jgi:hypothetical protein
MVGWSGRVVGGRMEYGFVPVVISQRMTSTELPGGDLMELSGQFGSRDISKAQG